MFLLRIFVNKQIYDMKNRNTILKIKVLGKLLDDTIFTRNYEDFFKHVSNIMTYDDLVGVLGEKVVTREEFKFLNYRKIGDYYVNTHYSTGTKINVIKRVCDHLGAKIEVIEHDYA